MKLSQIVNEEVTKGAASGTNDLESPHVKPGHFMEITHVAVGNRTAAYTRLTIGVAGGLNFSEMEEEDSPAADNVYWTRSKILVPAGKKLRARLTGCTAGDDLHLVYQGYLWREN